jgi:hypothetical protein
VEPRRELTATAHKTCAHKGCTREALMAISTTRGKTLFSRVFYDVAEAPPSASPYCHEDGVATIVALISTLVPADQPGQPESPAVAP